MRSIGRHARAEFVRDPLEAWTRARALDAMLGSARSPIQRGIVRGTHALLNAQQDRREAEAARRVEQAVPAPIQKSR